MNATDTATRTTPLPYDLPTGRSLGSGPSATPRGEARGYAQPELSIVIPTRNEAGNIMPLVQRLEAAVTDRPIEIIFVDDSDDDTPARSRRPRAQPRSRGSCLVAPRAGQRGPAASGRRGRGLRRRAARGSASWTPTFSTRPSSCDSCSSAPRRRRADRGRQPLLRRRDHRPLRAHAAGPLAASRPRPRRSCSPAACGVSATR